MYKEIELNYCDWPEEKKEASRAAHRKWLAKTDRSEYYDNYETQRGPRLEYKMLISAQERAKEKSLPFTIVESDIVVPSHCPICACKMQEAKGKRGGDSGSPTLDRIHGPDGYTPENVAVICKGCNSLKGKATPFELRRIADWIESITDLSS